MASRYTSAHDEAARWLVSKYPNMGRPRMPRTSSAFYNPPKPKREPAKATIQPIGPGMKPMARKPKRRKGSAVG